MTEGERWTRQVLADLRGRAYRPGAWWSFVAASFARARTDRAAHPVEHRQVLFVGVAGACAWAATAPWFPVIAVIGLVWWSTIVAMLDWHVGMLERPDGRPLGGIGAPNLISLTRLGAVPVLVALAPTGVGLAVLIGAATDVADGILARRWDLVTRLGRWLDGAADGAVFVTAALVLTAHGVIAGWVGGLVVARHAAQWVGVALGFFVRGAPPTPEHAVSARTTGAVMAAGIATAPFARGVGSALIVVGAAGGLIAVGLTARRVFAAAPEVR